MEAELGCGACVLIRVLPKRARVWARLYAYVCWWDATVNSTIIMRQVAEQCEVGKPGDVMPVTVGGSGVIVANHKGTIKAFHNVCRHRGAQHASKETVPTIKIDITYV